MTNILKPFLRHVSSTIRTSALAFASSSLAAAASFALASLAAAFSADSCKYHMHESIQKGKLRNRIGFRGKRRWNIEQILPPITFFL
jgi:hypothetical protein